ncbi:cytochrome P450 [Marasmius fiardii PR-910]|nr:cytochrome P450 [Marasmius fiardii PR-910]
MFLIPVRPMFAITVTVIAVCWLLRFLHRRSAPSLRNVRGPPLESFIFGNILKLISESAEGYEFHDDLAQNYGGVVKIHSILGAKDLYVFDHAAMESILVKQEPIFNMPDSLLAANHLIFGTCLVSTSGAQHRRGRKIMNPAFSPARLKALLPIIHEIAHQTVDAIASKIDGQRMDVDLSPFLGSTTLEFIGQAGLGHSFGAAGSVDTLHGMKELLQAAKRLIVPMQALPLMMKMLSPELRRYLIDYIPSSDLHTCRNLVDILDNTTKGILSRKKQALEVGDTLVAQLPGHGKDIISLLLKASSSAKSEDDQLSERELLGQMSVILFAGTDTTSTAMARCLQELSLDPELQNRLRQEVTAASPHGDLNFEQLNTLPLLETVCRETLRMYPPATTASRQALADAVIPLGKPMNGVDGKTITELFVPKGTLVHIGIKAANRDKSVWGTDATEWKPERWFSLPKTVTDAKIPGVYPKLMSFIGGPRGCIGFGFAEMTMKAFLAVLVKNFVFSPSQKKIVWKLGVAEAPTCEGEQSFPIVITPVST